jgi:hypothetical protein
MAVILQQIDEKYEVDTEKEAEELIAQAKEEFDITKSSTTYKYKKSEQREYWIVTLRKNFVEQQLD